MKALPLLLVLPISLACGSHANGPHDGGPSVPQDAGTGLESIPLTNSFSAPGLTGPVDAVRDTWGNPHIYGSSLPDLAYAQGYLEAHDRIIAMDFSRHYADGSLCYLIGTLEPAVVAGDVQMRANHLRDQAHANLLALQASSDPTDQLLLAALTRFAAGINAYANDLAAGKWQTPAAAFVWQPGSFVPWTAEDSLLLGELFAYELAYDAADEITATLEAQEGAAAFDSATDPALKARAGFGLDLQITAPFDPTFTISGWTGADGTTALRRRGVRRRGAGTPLQLLRDDRRALAQNAILARRTRSFGSNNWVVGPQLSATGHVMVANDTHLSVDNPATFWIAHLVDHGADGPIDVMGEQFPGVPAVTLGVNRHVAWGATVNYIDVTDVYQETITDCGDDAGPCALFQNQQVPLVARQETFQLGYAGAVSKTLTFTMYDVPHHGPLIPRVVQDAAGDVTGLSPLRGQELSVRYTGFETYGTRMLLKAVFGLDRAASMQEAIAALDQNFRYGGQNWVVGDDQGHFGWTQTIRVPRRAPPAPPQMNLPWHILPGDGTAEWGADMDPKYIPHAYDPPQGFLATANADPIGVTKANDPFVGQPQVGGGPLYLGWDYDPGTRVGRITKRIEAGVDGGARLTLDDMQSIQADVVTEWGQGFAPTFVAAASALIGEAAALAADGGAGPHPELDGYLAAAQGADGGFPAALLEDAHDLVAGWSFDTPAGVAADNPTAQQQADSKATLVMAYWISHFAHDTFDDELAKLTPPITPDTAQEEKLLYFLCADPRPTFLSTGISPVTGDSILFDDLGTPGVVESKLMIASKAIVEAIGAIVATQGPDPDKWAWGNVHTLSLNFLGSASIAPALNLPPPGDTQHPNGYPRHGDNGTVDVAGHGLDLTNFTQEDNGPAIRFVAELDPAGPKARNALPGGEIFDPTSPHYDDQLQLWLQNKTFDFAFADADVLAQAMAEYQKNQIGRWRFSPK